MTSPFIRRRRLGVKLRKLRESRDMTIDDMARVILQSRSKICKIENGQLRIDLYQLLNWLDTLQVTDRQREDIVQLAREAAEKGWWDRFGNSMGPRQRLAADLEWGAHTIRDYNQTGFPALMQTPEFTRALSDLDQADGPIAYVPERMAEARLRRQEHLLSADGPHYESILDEVVIRRLAVPAPVMSAQLRHLVGLVTGHARITVRVLPHDARIPGGLLPKSSFVLYTFPDKADPPMALVDTVTTDLLHTERREVARYTGHYDRLREAALSPVQSLGFLSEAADRLDEETGRT
ncbi:XRE family transcriptional regulator [Actinomadura craniellae]|uniref:XRE family transcriptional regulator n=1 Tax=Actinomadura craniellae TaxID=2231787 RepID=A0A365H4W3_9ACTN|nr:helix-turn-helix transcriptional regulator [Actinomadura craniellae]RAY14058.1 XRE family transcriptional regulator [Actinomadura craniellae]